MPISERSWNPACAKSSVCRIRPLRPKFRQAILNGNPRRPLPLLPRLLELPAAKTGVSAIAARSVGSDTILQTGVPHAARRLGAEYLFGVKWPRREVLRAKWCRLAIA